MEHEHGVRAALEQKTVASLRAPEDPQVREILDHQQNLVGATVGTLDRQRGEIEALVDEVISGNPDKVNEIRDGNDKLINWLTGQVMKASQGKANAKQVGDMLRAKIG